MNSRLFQNEVIVDLPDRFVQMQAPEIEDSPAHLKNPIFCPAVKYIEDKATIVESPNLSANLHSILKEILKKTKIVDF